MKRTFVGPALLLLAGCVSGPSGPLPVAPPTGPRNGLFISPMGEPFRSKAPGTDLITLWFDGADANRDGALDLGEMQRDAARFFRTLDANGDGELTPPEMVHYEQVIAPEIQLGSQMGPRPGMRGGFGRGRGPGQGDRERPDGAETEGAVAVVTGQPQGKAKPPLFRLPEGASRYGLLDMPQPVAAADSDFNRAVTAAEFAEATAERFQQLDRDRDGRLTRAELEPLPLPDPKTLRKQQREKGR